MQPVARCSRQKSSHGRHLTGTVERTGVHTHLFLQDISGNDDFRHHTRSARMQRVHLRMLLVRIDGSGQREPHGDRGVLRNPFTGRQSGLTAQILSGCIARREVEPQITQRSHSILLHVRQPAHRCGRFGRRSQLVRLLLQPDTEVTRFLCRAAVEHGRTLHVTMDHHGRRTAQCRQQPHPAAVTGHQRPFGRGQRNVKHALRMFSADHQRAGQPDRHLCHTDRILDVAGQHRRIERHLRHMVQFRTGLFLHKVPPPLDGPQCAVVLRIPRDAWRNRRFPGQTVRIHGNFPATAGTRQDRTAQPPVHRLFVQRVRSDFDRSTSRESSEDEQTQAGCLRRNGRCAGQPQQPALLSVGSRCRQYRSYRASC